MQLSAAGRTGLVQVEEPAAAPTMSIDNQHAPDKYQHVYMKALQCT